MLYGFEALAPYVALGFLVVLLAAFVWEKWPPDVVAVAAVALLLILDLLNIKEVFSVFSNSAPATIAAMFILSGALVRTGAIEAFGGVIHRIARSRPTVAISLLMGGTMLMSAFVNNTPVVIVMIPVVIGLAVSLQQSPSKFLIPLSYATIMGGTCTMIGTSTNLLVDGVAQGLGMEPFGIFEISGAGVLMAIAGMIYVVLVAPRLLPDRQSLSTLVGNRSGPRFITEVVVPYDSPLIGSLAVEVNLFRRADGRLIDVVRGEESLRRDLDRVVLEAGDRVILKTRAGEVISLREDSKVEFPGAHALEPLIARQATIAEGLVGPGSPMAGHPVGNLRLRRRYGVYPLAVHRAGENVSRDLDSVVLQVGDTVLMEGSAEDLERLSTDQGLINLSEPKDRPFRRTKAPFVVLIMLAVIALSALGVAEISALALIAVALVLLTRCVDVDEAYQAVDWRILVLIFGMLAVGLTLEKTGAIKVVVGAMAPYLHGHSPWILLIVIYVIVSLMTEIITNNAVAVLMTPIAYNLGVELGIDPRPLVVAVMFGASASFATPIGYQTNTMVYTAGGYRFTDFLKIGAPLNAIIGLVSVLIIPFFWPF
ncbi:SLC13 family permease [Haematospirillum sp. H1815]|uniref:SLC13 family permease n=1 Tax=Haematospirillum sp. H1815 TaxID=2723108 RepID=UPI00143A05F6|nr:SLC13 family permease [Haematospirillum sp. H1815]NKD77569.1 SLC13 family permease [Haematospirillum sp. H1815]